MTENHTEPEDVDELDQLNELDQPEAPTETPGYVCELSVDGFIDTLVGGEEDLITHQFSVDWTTLGDKKPTMLARACIMVHRVRGGQKVKEAKADAIAMPLGEVQVYFATPPEDANPEDPDSDEGKGSGLPD